MEAEEAQPAGCHIPNVVPLEMVPIFWAVYIELKRHCFEEDRGKQERFHSSLPSLIAQIVGPLWSNNQATFFDSDALLRNRCSK